MYIWSSVTVATRETCPKHKKWVIQLATWGYWKEWSTRKDGEWQQARGNQWLQTSGAAFAKQQRLAKEWNQLIWLLYQHVISGTKTYHDAAACASTSSGDQPAIFGLQHFTSGHDTTADPVLAPPSRSISTWHLVYLGGGWICTQLTWKAHDTAHRLNVFFKDLGPGFSETFMKISQVAKNFNPQEIFGKSFQKLQGGGPMDCSVLGTDDMGKAEAAYSEDSPTRGALDMLSTTNRSLVVDVHHAVIRDGGRCILLKIEM
ncbi:hypothetical protein DFH08DRAFT_807218 [Mycena albidolilacea]|uniref:Uncharacterized protein n=1 Tax=Mycena albidolilacea TaxID=1033008 RepID=A0AAD7A6C5_9AGAR|nr:hypothetical protein DFH08DRAFT_807218 [Mycena albidolilacea]